MAAVLSVIPSPTAPKMVGLHPVGDVPPPPPSPPHDASNMDNEAAAASRRGFRRILTLIIVAPQQKAIRRGLTGRLVRPDLRFDARRLAPALVPRDGFRRLRLRRRHRYRHL